MSFETYVCCNAKEINGKTCEARHELADGKAPPGWLIVLATRPKTVDDILRSADGQHFAPLLEMIKSRDFPAELRTHFEGIIATAIERAPRVELEAHLCPRHAGSMPMVDFHVVPDDEK